MIMASNSNMPLVNQQSSTHTKKRTALGVGITTLVTIVVVVLMTSFAVLTLVSAQSNLRLSEMAIAQAQRYYSADSEATVWYAGLEVQAANLTGGPSEYAQQLQRAGYTLLANDEDLLLVSQSFAVSEFRSLVVTVEINDDTTTTIRQWQS